MARSHLLQGLLVSRIAPMTSGRLTQALRWAKELAGQGGALPPLGFIADIGGMLTSHRDVAFAPGLPVVSGLEHTLTRRYEDYVLGKFAADQACLRAADSLLSYQGRERDQAVAYFISRLLDRVQFTGTQFTGTQLSPAVIDRLLKMPAAEVLQDAWDSVDQMGLSSLIVDQLDHLVNAIQRAGDVVGPEDLFELESGTAVAPLGQRIAIRQVLQTADLLRSEIPPQRSRVNGRQSSVATHLQQVDQYPIGGFHSITNRGTFESLVRSELAYMEDTERPDLFDIKYARHELLYYSRDESLFLRRRMAFAFVLNCDLKTTRVKDDELPVQRIVLLLACLCVVVQQLTDWLGEDSLCFEFIWCSEADSDPLESERQMIEVILREQIRRGNVFQRTLGVDQWQERVEELGRTCFCQAMLVSARSAKMLDAELPDQTTVMRIEKSGWDEWLRRLHDWLHMWCV
ncbi:MAG: hypothetical protein GY904_11400 [Planctomycetaceae bacterium]|nr:hypothetical protein [Planctomycetaceae bacterium]